MTTTTSSPAVPAAEASRGEGARPLSFTGHEDRIERLQKPFYIRWTCGPNYERAFLCVEDGEPDMRDFATVSFGMAELFKAGMLAMPLIEAQKAEASWGYKLDTLISLAAHNERVDKDDRVESPEQRKTIDRIQALRTEILAALASRAGSRQ